VINLEKIRIIFLILTLICASILCGCIEDDNGDQDDIKDGSDIIQGTLRLQITDKPPEIDIISANVTISMVKVHKAEAGDDEEDEEDDEEPIDDTENFTADADGEYEGSVGELIQFYGTASNGELPYNWTWDFGESNISYLQNPQHAYSIDGIYIVNLTVLDNNSEIAIDTTIATVVYNDEFDALAEKNPRLAQNPGVDALFKSNLSLVMISIK